jgi:hypothetical protein
VAQVTRRQMLALGLGSVALPSPFIAGGKAMADATPESVVYVSNAASKEIYVFAMNRDSGDLLIMDKVPVPGTDKPSTSSMPMAVTPDHRFLYAALRTDSFPVSCFAIDRERAAEPPVLHAATGQHGVYRDGQNRTVSAQRLLSRQQTDNQSYR